MFRASLISIPIYIPFTLITLGLLSLQKPIFTTRLQSIKAKIKMIRFILSPKFIKYFQSIAYIFSQVLKKIFCKSAIIIKSKLGTIYTMAFKSRKFYFIIKSCNDFMKLPKVYLLDLLKRILYFILIHPALQAAGNSNLKTEPVTRKG